MLPNPVDTVESLSRNFRSLAPNSEPHPRYSDAEEVQIARMGSVYAVCPLPPFTCTRATRRENARRGRGSRGYDTTFPLCRASRLGGKPRVGSLIQVEIGLTPSLRKVLENLVELVGIALLGGVDST
jgi:hypothetical protein